MSVWSLECQDCHCKGRYAPQGLEWPVLNHCPRCNSQNLNLTKISDDNYVCDGTSPDGLGINEEIEAIDAGVDFREALKAMEEYGRQSS